MGKGVKSLVPQEELLKFATDETVLNALTWWLEYGDTTREERHRIINYTKNIELWKLLLLSDSSCGTSCKCSESKICDKK